MIKRTPYRASIRDELRHLYGPMLGGYYNRSESARRKNPISAWTKVNDLIDLSEAYDVKTDLFMYLMLTEP